VNNSTIPNLTLLHAIHSHSITVASRYKLTLLCNITHLLASLHVSFKRHQRLRCSNVSQHVPLIIDSRLFTGTSSSEHICFLLIFSLLFVWLCAPDKAGYQQAIEHTYISAIVLYCILKLFGLTKKRKFLQVYSQWLCKAVCNVQSICSQNASLLQIFTINIMNTRCCAGELLLLKVLR